MDGNLNVRNNQIRAYCAANNKVLFDFADIESYDPDGNYYLDLGANDGCYYWIESVQHNWATEWCTANPGECSSCSCAHSQSLNCDMKGRAFWTMLAKLSAARAGDFNSDFCVNLSDLSIMLGSFGQNAGGDLNGDGSTDLSDLSILLGHYGGGCP